MVRLHTTSYLFGVYIFPPQDPITVRDVRNTHISGVYVGGVYIWLEDGTGLRTLYVVDNMFGWVRGWDHIEVWLAFTALHNIDDFFLEDDVEVGGEYNALRIDSVPELKDLIATSKQDIYHLTNLEWQCLVGWSLLTFEEQYRIKIHDCTADEMLEAMLDVEFVSELTGYIVKKDKTDEELSDYIVKTNIKKKLWFIDVDIRECPNIVYRLSKKPQQ